MNHYSRSIAVTFALAAMLTTTGLLSGCGSKHEASSIKSQSYANDGYLGRTNSYPKIPSRHMALNYDNDYKMMTQTIQNLNGIAGSSVVFNGADAYVTIKLKPDLPVRERQSVESQAATVLRFNFPRYNIHVQSAVFANPRR